MGQNKGITNNRYRALASDIIIFIIGTVLAKAIQFFLMPLYTTYMTTEAYGIAELTNNLSELFFPIATLCIYEAAFRFTVDPDFEDEHIVTIVAKVIGVSLAVGLIITLVCRFIFRYQYSFYLYFILYAYSIRICAAYYVRGKGMSKVFAMSGIVNALTLCLFNLIFLVYLQLGEVGYLISIGLSYCSSAIYLICRGNITKAIKIGVDSKRDLHMLLNYCIPLIFYNVLYWFTTISGRYILLWFSDSSTAGKYVAAIKIAAIINMIQQAVYAAFQLNSSKAYTEDNKEKYYSTTINLFIALYCTFGAVIVCSTPVLAKFTLKRDFYDARIYLPVIMLATLINCISSLLGTMYSTYKQTKRMVGVSVLGAGINIIVGALLTPIVGVWGVCISSVFCYFSQVLYKFIDIKKFANLAYDWKTVIPNITILIIQVVVMSLEIPHNLFLATLLTVIMFFVNIKAMKSMAMKLIIK